jgi:hypothetical protein
MKTVSQWREDAHALSRHIDSQLEYCKSLRDSKTLQSLTDVSESEKDKAKIIKWMELMKADIRNLNKMSRSDVYGLTEARAFEEKVKNADKDVVIDIREKSEWEQKTIELEERLRRYNLSLILDPSPKDLLELFTIREDQTKEIAQHLHNLKTKLDRDRGIDPEFLANDENVIGDSDFSHATIKIFQRVVKGFIDMERSVRDHMSRVITTSSKEAGLELKKKIEVLNTQLKVANDTIKDLQSQQHGQHYVLNSPRVGMVGAAGEGGKAAPTGREKVKLETAEAEIARLQGEYVAMREENVALVASNEAQREKNVRLMKELDTKVKLHSAQISW